MRLHYYLSIALLLLCQSAGYCPALSYERWAELIQKGTTLQKEHRYDEALTAYKQALSQAETLGEDDPRLTATLWALGSLYLDGLHQPATAAFYLERQQAILSRLGPDYQGLCEGMECLARAYRDQRKYAQAERLLLRALKIRPTGYALKAKDFYFDIENDLGHLYQDQRRYGQAETCFKNMLAHALKKYGNQDDEDLRIAYYWLAELYRVSGRYNEAIPQYMKELQLCQRHPEWGEPGYNEAACQWNLGRVYGPLGKNDEALSWYMRAIKTAGKYPNDWNLVVYSLYPGIAIIERKLGHYEQAAQCAHQALKLAEQHPLDKRSAIANEIRQFLQNLSRRP